MLHYTEIGLSHREVPNETSLCIYISGCPFNCPGCHYPELQRTDFGDILADHFEKIIDLYLKQATCVCFLGEGSGSIEDRAELLRCAAYTHHLGLKCCLYSGRDTIIEPWMESFDYIKLGSYQESLGALDSPATNQHLYKKIDGHYTDITHIFWT